MPLYYFHVRSECHNLPDPEGSECRDNEAALHEARVSARELSADRLRRGMTTQDVQFEVRDASGAVVGTVPFPRTAE